jgi:hypothetical protein
VLDCFLEGVVQITDCVLEGTAVITVPPPPPPCERPEGLLQDAFFTGYDIVEPPSNVASTGSLSDACNAVAYLNTFDEFYENVIPTYILAEYQGLYVGSYVYVSNGTNNCDTIPDGWYFTGETQAANTVIHVVGGIIVEIVDCSSPTTTTTTTMGGSTTTTTSSSSTSSTTSTTSTSSSTSTTSSSTSTTSSSTSTTSSTSSTSTTSTSSTSTTTSTTTAAPDCDLDGTAEEITTTTTTTNFIPK